MPTQKQVTTSQTKKSVSTKKTETMSRAKKEALGAELAELLVSSLEGGVDPFQGFIGLTRQLKKKQEELDIMAADSLPAAILTDFVSDVLLPNSSGDLVSVVAEDPNCQTVISSIYRRLALPAEKIIYSIFKNGIVIGEFEQFSQRSIAAQAAANEQHLASPTELLSKQTQEIDAAFEDSLKEAGYSVANESVSVKAKKSAKEATYVRDPGTILPNLAIISDTYTVFPILQYERCVGYIEIKKDRTFFDTFNWETDQLEYKDVVIHSSLDYCYETFGVSSSSKPLQLTVLDESGTPKVYDVAVGHSILEDAYSAWKTLSLLQDSVVLASLIKNAQIMLIEVNGGPASKQQIEAAKIKLRSLFEGQLTMGRQGMKSYLNPQSKPAYIYSFTNGDIGKITAQLVGGEYNPGQLYYLTPFVNQFFAAMRAPKQNYGFTEGAGGLDGGGAVEQYNQRYKSTVARVKRIFGSFIKRAINNVLMAKGLTRLVDAFDVKVFGAYDEVRNQEVQEQQTKLSLYDAVINFIGVDDKEKQSKLRSLMIKDVITNSQITKIIDQVLSEAEEPPQPDSNETVDNMGDTQITPDVGDEIGGTGGEEMPLELPEDVDAAGGDTTDTDSVELPDMNETI